MSEIRPAAVIILAAGEGRRMKSGTPKVLHTMCGRSLLGHVLGAAAGLEPGRLIVVVGQGRRLFPDRGRDIALDLVESRAFPKGIVLQVYRPAGRPQYATD